MTLEEMEDNLRNDLKEVKKETKDSFKEIPPNDPLNLSIPEPSWDFWMWLFVGGFLAYVMIILLVEYWK